MVFNPLGYIVKHGGTRLGSISEDKSVAPPAPTTSDSISPAIQTTALNTDVQGWSRWDHRDSIPQATASTDNPAKDSANSADAQNISEKISLNEYVTDNINQAKGSTESLQKQDSIESSANDRSNNSNADLFLMDSASDTDKSSAEKKLEELFEL